MCNYACTHIHMNTCVTYATISLCDTFSIHMLFMWAFYVYVLHTEHRTHNMHKNMCGKA